MMKYLLFFSYEERRVQRELQVPTFFMPVPEMEFILSYGESGEDSDDYDVHAQIESVTLDLAQEEMTIYLSGFPHAELVAQRPGWFSWPITTQLNETEIREQTQARKISDRQLPAFKYFFYIISPQHEAQLQVNFTFMPSAEMELIIPGIGPDKETLIIDMLTYDPRTNELTAYFETDDPQIAKKIIAHPSLKWEVI